jgi:hypothetical protein
VKNESEFQVICHSSEKKKLHTIETRDGTFSSVGIFELDEYEVGAERGPAGVRDSASTLL